MSELVPSALTPEEWENRALWRPGSDAEFDSGALWASEVLPDDFPALIALVNAEARIVTWSMVEHLRGAADALTRLGDASAAPLADALLVDAITLEAILPPRTDD